MSSQPLRIYVDLDDVLGETARAFLGVYERKWARRVGFEELTVFDLGQSLDLDRDRLAEFLEAVHEPQVLDGVAPMSGALETIAGWRDAGHSITVVSGRPTATREISRAWLDRHGFPYESFVLVDKYSRYYRGAHGDSDGALGLGDLEELGFGFAVEDFPGTAAWLAETLEIPVALYDRPWNRDLDELSAAARRRIVRCRDWAEVDAALPAKGPAKEPTDRPADRSAG